MTCMCISYNPKHRIKQKVGDIKERIGELEKKTLASLEVTVDSNGRELDHK